MASQWEIERSTTLTLGAHAQEGYSSLSVSHATLYQATWYVYTLKVRYHRILHELFKSFDSWISLKVFS